jgi:3-deoxy-D-manno-octulosonic-acid transferase
VAKAIAQELLKLCPQVQLTITTSTGKGLEEARRSLAGMARVAVFPLEMPWSVVSLAAKVQPQVYASLETELWPNLFAWLGSRGCELLLLNGRISQRSFPGYKKARTLLRPTLRRLSLLSMISDGDAKRIIELGADPAKVRVDGNAKFAGLAKRVNQEALKEIALTLDLGDAPLFVAGSTRSGEEEPVLQAFDQVLKSHSDAVLAVAPRHVEKSPNWIKASAALGLTTQYWSELSPMSPRHEDTKVVVVDAMGQLFNLYGLAFAAFIGASLVDLGGQNPMEPAAWGTLILHGRHMEDFSDAAAALAGAGAAKTVADSRELAVVLKGLLDNPAKAKASGQAGLAVVDQWSDSAKTAAILIYNALKRKGVVR